MPRANVDERIVELSFDNAQFERETRKSMQTLDALKTSLDFSSLKTGLDDVQKAIGATTFNPLASGLGLINTGFSSMEQVAIRVLGTISEKILGLASDAAGLVSELTFDQVGSGFEKYSSKTKAVQTMMAATRDQYASDEEQMAAVTAQLEKLNWFTDETSYNFLDMVSNIGKFTSNAIALEDAVTAMEGISVWAALAGAGPTEAARAMYNLSQAIGRGYIQAIDWRSIENANMQTAEFKQLVIDAAVALGTLQDRGNGQYLSGVSSKGIERFVTVADFTSSLSEDKWFTNDVLMLALSKYGDFTDALYEEMQKVDVDTASGFLEMIDEYKNGTLDMAKATEEAGVNVDVLEPILQRLSSDEFELGRRAFAAAQEALTLEQAIESVKDAASTAWMNIWEHVFGDYLTAKKAWTTVANELWDVFVGPVKALEGAFAAWDELGGRETIFAGVANVWSSIRTILDTVGEAFTDVFGKFDVEVLLKISDGFLNLSKALLIQEDSSDGARTALLNFQGVVYGFFSFFDIFKNIGSAFVTVFGGDIVKALSIASRVFGSLAATLGNAINRFDVFLYDSNILVRAFSGIRSGIVTAGNVVIDVIDKVISKIGELFHLDISLPSFDKILGFVEELPDKILNWSPKNLFSNLFLGTKDTKSIQQGSDLDLYLHYWEQWAEGITPETFVTYVKVRMKSIKERCREIVGNFGQDLLQSIRGDRLPDEFQNGPRNPNGLHLFTPVANQIDGLDSLLNRFEKIKHRLQSFIETVKEFYARYSAILHERAQNVLDSIEYPDWYINYDSTEFDTEELKRSFGSVAMIEFIEKAKSSFAEFRSNHPIIDGIFTFFEQVAEKIKEAWIAIKPYLPTMDDIFNFFSWVGEKIQNVWRVVQPNLPTWETITNAFSTVFAKLKELFDKFNVGSFFSDLYSGGIGIVKEVLSWFSEDAVELSEDSNYQSIAKESTFGEKILLAVQNVMTFLGRLGSTIIQGLQGFTGWKNLSQYVDAIVVFLRAKGLYSLGTALQGFIENGFTLFSLKKTVTSSKDKSISKTILRIAGSILLIVASLKLLTTIDPDALESYVGKIIKWTIILGVIGAAMMGISIILKKKFPTKKEVGDIGTQLNAVAHLVTNIGLGLLLLAASTFIIGKFLNGWDIASVFALLIAVLLPITAFGYFVSKFKLNFKSASMKDLGESILNLGKGLSKFAVALLIFKVVSPNLGLLISFGLWITFLLGITAGLAYLSKRFDLDFESVVKIGDTLQKLASALLVMGAAMFVINLTLRSPGAFLKSVLMIGLLLGSLFALAKLNSKYSANIKDLKDIGKVMNEMAASLVVLAIAMTVLNIFAGWGGVGKAAVVLIEVIGTIGIILALLKKTKSDVKTAPEVGKLLLAAGVSLFGAALGLSWIAKYDWGSLLAAGGAMLLALTGVGIALSAMSDIITAPGSTVAAGVTMAGVILAIGWALSWFKTDVDIGAILASAAAIAVLSWAIGGIVSLVASIQGVTFSIGEFVAVGATIAGVMLAGAAALWILEQAIVDFCRAFGWIPDTVDSATERTVTKGDLMASAAETNSHRFINAFDPDKSAKRGLEFVDGITGSIEDGTTRSIPGISKSGSELGTSYGQELTRGIDSNVNPYDYLTGSFGNGAIDNALIGYAQSTGGSYAGGLKSGMNGEFDVTAVLNEMMNDPAIGQMMQQFGVDPATFYNTGLGDTLSSFDLSGVVSSLFSNPQVSSSIFGYGETDGGTYANGVIGNLEGGLTSGDIGGIISSILGGSQVTSAANASGLAVGGLFNENLIGNIFSQGAVDDLLGKIGTGLGIEDLSGTSIENGLSILGGSIGSGIVSNIFGEGDVQTVLSNIGTALGIEDLSTTDLGTVLESLGGKIGSGIIDGILPRSAKEEVLGKAVVWVSHNILNNQELKDWFAEVGKTIGSSIVGGIFDALTGGIKEVSNYIGEQLQPVLDASSVNMLGLPDLTDKGTLDEYLAEHADLLSMESHHKALFERFRTAARYYGNEAAAEWSDEAILAFAQKSAEKLQSEQMYNALEEAFANDPHAPGNAEYVSPFSFQAALELGNVTLEDLSTPTLEPHEIAFNELAEKIQNGKLFSGIALLDAFKVGDIKKDELIALWGLYDFERTGEIAISETLDNMVKYLETNDIFANIPTQEGYYSDGVWQERGMSLIESLRHGIYDEDTVNQLLDTVRGVGKDVIDTFKSEESEFTVTGEEFSSEISKGMQNKSDDVNNAAMSIAGRASTTLGTYHSSMKVNSEFMMEGVVQGIRSKVGSVVSSISSVCSNIAGTFKGFFGIASPSKVTTEWGMYLDQGLVNGLTKYAGTVEDAAGAVSNSTVSALTDPLTLLTDRMEAGFAEPSIVPVFDLSNVQNGLNDMNGLLVGNASQLSTAMRSPNNTVNIIAESGILSEIRSIREEMNTLHQAITELNNLQVTLDSRALVGSLAKPMDNALGRRTVHAARRN